MKTLDKNKVRVIKISKDALFEFLYESFMEKQELFFDIDPLEATNTCAIDFENGTFLFCACKIEDITKDFQEIDLDKLMAVLPDTTSTMFSDERYQEYSKDELKRLSKS